MELLLFTAILINPLPNGFCGGKMLNGTGWDKTKFLGFEREIRLMKIQYDTKTKKKLLLILLIITPPNLD